MIYLVLDDLGGEIRVSLYATFELCRLIAHLYYFIPSAFSRAAEEGKTALLRFASAVLLYDFRIQHNGINGSLAVFVKKGNYALLLPDHICRHTYAGILMRCQRVKQILSYGQVFFCRNLRFSGEEYRVMNKRLYHVLSSVLYVNLLRLRGNDRHTRRFYLSEPLLPTLFSAK